MTTRVAVILVNWNSFDVTNDCILSLKQCSGPAFTAIVVDNGSIDGSADRLAKSHPDIVLLRSEKNLGFTGGNNLGFAYSLANGFSFSMMLNNDTFVAPDFIQHLVNYMDAHPEAGIIQPRIHFNHNRNLLWNGGSYYNRWLGYFYTSGENKLPASKHLVIKQVDWITGCAFFVRNDILRKTGLLADNMFIYSEDVDLSLRIRSLGYKLVYHPDSIVYHIAGMSNKSKVKGKEGVVNPIVHYLNQRNRIWVLKKYTPWYFAPSALLFNLFYITAIMGYFASRGRFQKLRAVIRATRDGIAGKIETKQV
ncbi:glycosyltransferase family 2 protein [Sediminibacterium soli]|uniref:glycosyltransferase family 2 protein n=1 Tax=Sediminibacterium soli TaxID=2698829 RepID=UPI00137B08CA|nr:glycosyltransferase family 2 protein [Sediminibacterium soli]NCI48047.1 glycosyltransferase family 2 protein [Sediminibacterium soli]